MAKIFLSYNRKGAALVEGLIEDLEELGHDVWFDQELSGGVDWWDRILTEIRGRDLFVLVLTKESLDSLACKREWGYAAAQPCGLRVP